MNHTQDLLNWAFQPEDHIQSTINYLTADTDSPKKDNSIETKITQFYSSPELHPK
jgi:hypothetical protein